MNVPQYPIFAVLPPLSDEAASLILDFLFELLYQFEAAYAAQIRRYRHHEDDAPLPPSQLDLFNNPHNPPF